MTSSLLGIALFAGLGGFLFGYDLGLIGGALLAIEEGMGVTSTLAASAIVGAFKLGAFFGTFFGGATMLRYGRRRAIATSSIFTTLGPIIMSASQGTGGLIVGRLVGGFGVGSCAIIVPAYLAEMAPAQRRGAVVQVYELMLTIGMLVAMLVDWALSQAGKHAWRIMVGLPAVPGAMLALALVVLPESPRWLVMRGELDAALHTLRKVYGRQAGAAHGEHHIHHHHHQHHHQRRRQQDQQQDSAAPAHTGAVDGATHSAEHELMLLWSSVEKDKQAVLQRRRQLLQRMAWRTCDADTELQAFPLLASQSAAVGGDRGRGSSNSSSSMAHRHGAASHAASMVGGPAAPPSPPSATCGCVSEEATAVLMSSVGDPGISSNSSTRLDSNDGTSSPPWHSSSSVPDGCTAVTDVRPVATTFCTGGRDGGGGAATPTAHAEAPDNGLPNPVSTTMRLPVASAPTVGTCAGAAAGVVVGSGVAAGDGADVTPTPACTDIAADNASDDVWAVGQRSGVDAADVESSTPLMASGGSAGIVHRGGRVGDGRTQAHHRWVGEPSTADVIAGADSDAIMCTQHAAHAVAAGTRKGHPAGHGAHHAFDTAGSSGLSGAECVQAGAAHAMMLTSARGGGSHDNGGGSGGLGSDIEPQPGHERTLLHTLASMLLDVVLVARGPERRAFSIAVWLAVFNQANASSAVINFGSTLLVRTRAGRQLSEPDAVALEMAVAGTKVVGVGLGMALVDRFGRRPLLLWGAAGCSCGMLALVAATVLCSPVAVLASMCLFILTFSASWAGLYWVLVAELFSMSAKSPAAATATATLFLSGAVTNVVFLALVDACGGAAFFVFAAVAAASGVYVWSCLPETKGRTLAEIQEILAVRSSDTDA